jgi:hypothetical protein
MACRSLQEITTNSHTVVAALVVSYCLVNSFQAIVLLTGQEKGVLFLRGHISLKNWSFRPLLRDSTSHFKSSCLLFRLKEVLDALYHRNGLC